MIGPRITVQKTDNRKALDANIKQASRQAVYVGIPDSSSRVKSDVLRQISGRGRARKATGAAKQVSNAELLWIQSKGSPLKGIPARPVLEPAIEANKQQIAAELAGALRSTLAGNQGEAERYLNRAGMAGRNAARRWFFDPRNGWKKNAASTIARKGSSQPLIDTGAMRNAITYVVETPRVSSYHQNAEPWEGPVVPEE